MAKVTNPSDRHFKRTDAQQAKPARNTRFLFFVLVIFFFGLANMLVMNDVATVWPGAEAHLFSAVAQGDVANYLPAQVVAPYLDIDTAWLFKSRLNGVILLGITLALFGFLGRGLLGNQAVIFTLMVVLATFLLPLQAKLTTGDPYALLGQLLFWLLLLQYLKNPKKKEYALLLVAGLFCAIAAPFPSLILALGLGVLLGWLHPQGRLLLRWHGWLFVGVPAVAALFSQGLPLVGAPYLVWSLQGSDYLTLLLFSVLGAAPFFGFLVAGLRDLVYKCRRGEELSLLLAGSLVAALLAQSLLFPFLLAMVIGKQLVAYFADNYPWQDWVRTGALLQLVGSFVLIVIVLVGGSMTLGDEVFRAALGCCAAYWIFSLAGVVGLYGMRYDLTWGGPLLAGTVSLLFFWLQLYPFWEGLRNWPAQLINYASTTRTEQLYLPRTEATLIAHPYLHRAPLLTAHYLSTEQATLDTLQSGTPGLYVLSTPPALTSVDSIVTLNYKLQPIVWYLYPQR